MSYELGQRAALEKLAVFSEWIASLPRPADRQLPVRGRGANFPAAAQDAITNIKEKYLDKAPSTAQRTIDAIEKMIVPMSDADVQHLRIGNERGHAGTFFSGPKHRVQIGMRPHLEGALAHELGHARPKGYDPRLDRRLGEEARATNNAAAALGKDHPDMPFLLQAFGTYHQDRNPIPGVGKHNPFAALEARMSALEARPTAHPDVIEAAALRDAASKKIPAQISSEASKELEAINGTIDELKKRLPGADTDTKKQLFRKIMHYKKRAAGIEKYYDEQRAARAAGLDAHVESAVARIKATAERSAARAKARTRYPTLRTLADLRGAERTNLDAWIEQARNELDNRFWRGAGDTALSPILTELNRRRPSQAAPVPAPAPAAVSAPQPAPRPQPPPVLPAPAKRYSWSDARRYK